MFFSLPVYTNETAHKHFFYLFIIFCLYSHSFKFSLCAQIHTLLQFDSILISNSFIFFLCFFRPSFFFSFQLCVAKWHVQNRKCFWTTHTHIMQKWTWAWFDLARTKLGVRLNQANILLRYRKKNIFREIEKKQEQVQGRKWKWRRKKEQHILKRNKQQAATMWHYTETNICNSSLSLSVYIGPSTQFIICMLTADIQTNTHTHRIVNTCLTKS